MQRFYLKRRSHSQRGKFTRGGTEENNARRAKFDYPPLNLERAYDVIEAMQRIAGREKATVAQVALAWLLHQPAVTSVILGAKNEKQLNDNQGADDLRELNGVSKLPREYPGWVLDMEPAGRPGEVRDWSKVTKSS